MAPFIMQKKRISLVLGTLTWKVNKPLKCIQYEISYSVIM